MPLVQVDTNVPGIRALMQFRPETGEPLMILAEALLRGPSPLSRGDRELIATYVSRRNDCTFCTRSHAAFAGAQLEGGTALVDAVLENRETAPITPKMRALLAIAEAVAKGGKNVSDPLVEAARAEGVTDVELHDAVLVAAAFCMFNRYVDGLRATTPTDASAYDAMATRITSCGYHR